MRVLKTVLYLFFLVFIGDDALAIEYSYSLFSTLSYSDNLNPNLEDPSGASTNNGFSFNINTDSNSDWVLATSGSYAKEIFSLSEIPDQEDKQLSFNLNYDAQGSNFTLLMRDDFSQAPQNRTATQEFNNIADINIITVRPEYYFRISPREGIFLQGGYLDSNRKDQSTIAADGFSFDTKSISSSIRYQRRIDETSDVSLVIRTTDNEIDGNTGQASTDFIQQDAFIRWVIRGRNNQLQLEYGKSTVEDQFDAEFDSNLYRVFFSRQINRTDQFSLSYRKGFFVTISNNFANNSVDVSDQSFGSAQEFVSSNVSYIHAGTFVTVSIDASNQKFNSTGNSSTQDSKGYGLSISYSLARVLLTSLDTNLQLTIRKNIQTFVDSSNASIDASSNNIRFSFNYVYSPSLSYYAALAIRKSDGNNPNIQLLGGDSSSFSIGLVYSPRSIVQEFNPF